MHEHRIFYLKNIVSKRHDEYEYSPLEAALSKFISQLGEFFSLLWGFAPIMRVVPLLSHWSNNSNVQLALDAWKHMVFTHG